MQLTRCSHCGCDPIIPCPVCGSYDTEPILKSSPGVPGTGHGPERVCSDCGFGFWPGHRTSPVFPPDGDRTTGLAVRPVPPYAAALRHMFEAAIAHLDPSGVVADEATLDAALDAATNDRWWWKDIDELQVVCSSECVGEVLRQSDAALLSVWFGSPNGWSLIAGRRPTPDRTSLVRLTSRRDPAGVLFLHEPGRTVLFTPPNGGPVDRRLLTWRLPRTGPYGPREPSER